MLGGRTHAAEGLFQPCWGKQSEYSQSGRADHKCMRLESGEKDAFPCSYLESFLFYIDVELSFQNVEELILARMYMRRWFSSGRQQCLHQKEGSVGILRFSEVSRQISIFPLRQAEGW